MRIAVITDTHYFKMNGINEEILKIRDAFFHELLYQFFSVEADYYISLGDLTHGGSSEEFSYFLNYAEERKLRSKFLPVLGNHDLICSTKEEVLALTGQPRYYMIDSQEARLIFLDTCLEKNPYGYIDNQQLDWLRQVIQCSKQKPLLVFSHHPVYGTTARSMEDNGKQAVGPEFDIQKILELYEGKGLYINGHMHVNSIVGVNRWFYIQTASALIAPGFRIIDINESSTKIEYVQLNYEILQQNRIVAEHTKPFVFRSDVLGSDNDKTLVIQRGN